MQDRLDTLDHVRSANIKVCSGGIVGMGETREGRAGLIAQLANGTYPSRCPSTTWCAPGTRWLTPAARPLEFVRTIAVARITMPTARVRLSAGRQQMSEAVQAMCFLAGANSIFYGDKLLTTGNPEVERDRLLMEKLGLRSGQAVTARASTPPDAAQWPPTHMQVPPASKFLTVMVPIAGASYFTPAMAEMNCDTLKVVVMGLDSSVTSVTGRPSYTSAGRVTGCRHGADKLFRTQIAGVLRTDLHHEVGEVQQKPNQARPSCRCHRLHRRCSCFPHPGFQGGEGTSRSHQRRNSEGGQGESFGDGVHGATSDEIALVSATPHIGLRPQSH